MSQLPSTDVFKKIFLSQLAYYSVFSQELCFLSKVGGTGDQKRLVLVMCWTKYSFGTRLQMQIILMQRQELIWPIIFRCLKYLLWKSVLLLFQQWGWRGMESVQPKAHSFQGNYNGWGPPPRSRFTTLIPLCFWQRQTGRLLRALFSGVHPLLRNGRQTTPPDCTKTATLVFSQHWVCKGNLLMTVFFFYTQSFFWYKEL